MKRDGSGPKWPTFRKGQLNRSSQTVFKVTYNNPSLKRLLV